MRIGWVIIWVIQITQLQAQSFRVTDNFVQNLSSVAVTGYLPEYPENAFIRPNMMIDSVTGKYRPDFMNFMLNGRRNANAKFVIKESKSSAGKGTNVSKTDSILTRIEDLTQLVDTLRIKRINLTDNGLLEFPESIYRYPNVEVIVLNKNKIAKLNLDFSRLTKLKQLHLQDNLLTAEHLELSKNSSLEVLNLNRNFFTDIPISVKKCKNLKHLYLAANNLNELNSKSFGRIKQVVNLNFYKANLKVVPSGIRKVRKLEVLDLYHNHLTKIPNEVTTLRHITHLAISYNALLELPEDIGKMRSLHSIYAHHNQISRLPESITQLKSLVVLDIGFNQFVDFPTQIKSFRYLKELDLSSNRFTEFPKELLLIPPVEKLYLGGNPFLLNEKKTPQWDALKGKNIQIFY